MLSNYMVNKFHIENDIEYDIFCLIIYDRDSVKQRNSCAYGSTVRMSQRCACD